jgi:hypothetical protein
MFAAPVAAPVSKVEEDGGEWTPEDVARAEMEAEEAAAVAEREKQEVSAALASRPRRRSSPPPPRPA